MLQRTGIGAGVAVAGTAGLVGYYQPRKEFYLQSAEGAEVKERLELSKKVVVIGGGLAGITASLELARKGFAVTLCLGILTTIFTAFTVTRVIVAAWYRYFKPKVVPI